MVKEDDPLIQRAAASRNTIAHVLASVPVNVNGLALGACGLGVLWQTASELLEFPPSLKLLSDLISLLTLNVAGSLVLLYLCKVITAPAAAKRDVESPDSAAILCTLDMALMSMAWVLHRHGVHVAAMAIWAFAACMHTVVLGLFLCHVFPQLFLSASALSEDAMGLQALLEAYQPAWMIPPIGICMASGTGRALGLGAWVEVFFYVGLLFFVFLLPLSIYRCHMMPQPLPGHLQAAYAINIAPAALLLCQWVALGGNEEHALSHALFVIEGRLRPCVRVLCRSKRETCQPACKANSIRCKCSVRQYHVCGFLSHPSMQWWSWG